MKELSKEFSELSEQLQPCPFCGGKVEIHHMEIQVGGFYSSFENVDKIDKFSISHDSGILCKHLGVPISWDNVENMVRSWNFRPTA